MSKKRRCGIRKGCIFNKACVTAVISAFFLAQTSDVCAWGWRNRHHGRYRPGSKKVIVKQHYLSPIVKGMTTLYGWALLNQRCNSNYIVKTVPAATVVVAPATEKATERTIIVTPCAREAPEEQVTIYIPNGSGGYTAVNLKKAGDGYMGPQGELYPEHPTVEQLQTLYGQ